MRNKLHRKLTKFEGFKKSTLALSIAATIPVSNVYAEDAIKVLPQISIDAEQDSYKADELSSNKYNRPLAETPKTITVITEEVMKDRGYTSLEESLRSVSGITLAAGEGGAPTGDSLYIRGFSARTDIFIDGLRDVAGYSRDIYNTEAIEVSKGPGSSVSGRGSVGGTINLSTKKATLGDFTDVRASYGTEHDHRITLDSNNILGETTAIRVNLLTTDGDVAGRDEVENGMEAIALSIGTGLGTDTRFTLSAEYQDQDNLPDYGLPWVPNYSGRTDRAIGGELAALEGTPLPESLYDNFYGNVNRDFEDISAKNVTALFEKDLTDNSMVYVQARYGIVDRNTIVTAPRFAYRTVNGVRIYGLDGIRLDDEKMRDQETSLFAIQTAYIATLGRHDFSVGLEYYIEKEQRWEISANGTDNLLSQTNDVYNPNPNLAYTGTYSRTGLSNSAKSKTIAAYVFDTITLSDKWTLNTGLRLENHESNTRPTYGDSTLALTRDDNLFSWNIGAVYKIRENGNVYFSVGKSFNPAAEDLTVRARGNEIDLEPEESYGYELGTKWELFNDNLLLSGAIFRTEKTNARSDDPFDGIDGSDTRANMLEGEQYVQGLELSAFGQITPELSVAASYTFQDSEVTKATGADVDQMGNDLARTPRNSMSIWANYMPTPKWELGLGYVYVDERHNSPSTGGRETAPDYHLVDTMASYQATQNLKLQLNGNNIFDERYISLVGGGHFVPGAGRSFTLSASYSF